MSPVRKSTRVSTAAGTTTTVSIVLNGTEMEVPAAVSVAAALTLHGLAAMRTSIPSGDPRGVFCGMGSCHECAVTINGVHGVRSCITPVAQGLRVTTEAGEHQ